MQLNQEFINSFTKEMVIGIAILIIIYIINKIVQYRESANHHKPVNVIIKEVNPSPEKNEEQIKEVVSSNKIREQSYGRH